MSASRHTESSQPPPTLIQAEVTSDGSVNVEGETFSDSEKLKAKWAEITKKHPNAFASLQTPKGTTPETMGKSIALLRQAGINSVGFITEPRNVSEK
jgi:biopolymer transport protein ExbD